MGVVVGESHVDFRVSAVAICLLKWRQRTMQMFSDDVGSETTVDGSNDTSAPSVEAKEVARTPRFNNIHKR